MFHSEHGLQQQASAYVQATVPLYNEQDAAFKQTVKNGKETAIVRVYYMPNVTLRRILLG
jgi:hypothetical protein